jgi:predicted porin
MKKILLLVLPLVCVTFLMASHLTPLELGNGLDLTYGGEFRTRAIMNNDLNENNGGWFDNRLRFDLAAKLGDKIGIVWTPEVGDIVWADYGTKNVPIETRELYLDYQMNWMETKVRLGQQYWYDHRSLVLDDYFSGITSDLNIAGIPAELGFIKGYEGAVNMLDDAHVAFANFVFKAPVEWGLTAMWGQQHAYKTADIWIIPYLMLNFNPVSLDLTAVLDNKMFKDALGEDDSEMGMAVAAKVNFDLGAKLGLDLLYVDKKEINTLSSYYVNGLYLFGNQLPFDGVQICSDYSGWGGENGEAYMSIVGSASYAFNGMMEIYGAVGMASAKDPIGTELNVGLNCKIVDKLTFNPVLAIGQTGKALEPDFGGEEQTNMVYMLGGLLKAEF